MTSTRRLKFWQSMFTFLGVLDGTVLHCDHLPLPVLARVQRRPRPHVPGIKKLHNQLGDGSHKFEVDF